MNTSENSTLSNEEQAVLLRIARDSLEARAQGRVAVRIHDYPLTPMLRQPCGAFVTLRNAGRLRGCIGYTKSTTPLARTVADNAVNAGFNDTRFDPVAPDEPAEITIEISVMLPGPEKGSPFIPVTDVHEIIVGQDGLYLEHAEMRWAGLLLPQVPGEQGWDRDDFLKGLCLKAGAPADAWRDPASRLYRFRSQVFSEEAG